MAEAKQQPQQPQQQELFTGYEKQWLQKAVQTQRDQLKRSLGREIPGSEIYRLRNLEIQQLDQLKAKIS